MCLVCIDVIAMRRAREYIFDTRIENAVTHRGTIFGAYFLSHSISFALIRTMAKCQPQKIHSPIHSARTTKF